MRWVIRRIGLAALSHAVMHGFLGIFSLAHWPDGICSHMKHPCCGIAQHTWGNRVYSWSYNPPHRTRVHRLRLSAASPGRFSPRAGCLHTRRPTLPCPPLFPESRLNVLPFCINSERLVGMLNKATPLASVAFPEVGRAPPQDVFRTPSGPDRVPHPHTFDGHLSGKLPPGRCRFLPPGMQGGSRVGTGRRPPEFSRRGFSAAGRNSAVTRLNCVRRTPRDCSQRSRAQRRPCRYRRESGRHLG
jgi:hypothetical protein